MNETENETKNEETEAQDVNVESEAATEEDNVVELESASEAEVVEEKKEEDFKSKYFYLAAEMQNLTKRHQREREGLLKFGSEKILTGLLEVVDNLDRTLQAIENDEDEKVKNIANGIEMVKTQFIGVLKQNGLEEVESLGKAFDPNFHEAMAQQPAEGIEDEEIIQEFQKGYILNGRLLRAAKVIIAKNN